MSRLLLALAAAGFLFGCAGTGGDQVPLQTDDLLSGKSDAQNQLRPTAPVTVQPGVWIEDQVLHHAAIDADVDLSGLFDVQIDVSVPLDFWTEVGAYLVDLDAPTTVDVQLDGPRVAALWKRIGSDESAYDQDSTDFTFGAAEPGRYLLMIIPLELHPDSTEVHYDLLVQSDG